MKNARISGIFSILIIIAALTVSCNKSNKTPDISHIQCNVVVLRFEKDLFSSDFEHITDSVPFFLKKYGEFFEMFNHKIIKIGSYKSPAYTEYLKGFVTDYDINQLRKTTDSVFADISSIEKQINEVFRYYKYYFPNSPVPTVITYISGYNQSMVSSDTILGIGLDKYLGSNHVYYTRLGLANYMKQNMYPTKIPSDCARAWAMTQFTMNNESAGMLEHMIYQGKIIYFTKLLLPTADDSLVTGFSKKQLEWCINNENGMWTFLIENKLLFKTDYQTIAKFVGDAPFTKGFGRNSPGKAAAWIGFRIVQQYMEKNSSQSLAGLMAETDYQKILRESKYKP